MRTRYAFGMKPPIISGRYFKGHHFVLQIVSADINLISVIGRNMKRFGLGHPALSLGSAVLSFGGINPTQTFDISSLPKLGLDLRQIIFRLCQGNIGHYPFQIFDFLFVFPNLFRQCLCGSFALIVFIEIPYGIFGYGFIGIQMNDPVLVFIIVENFRLVQPFLDLVSVCIQQFPADSVFFSVLGIGKLLLLQIEFLIIAL